jgi:hypothetical protein
MLYGVIPQLRTQKQAERYGNTDVTLWRVNMFKSETFQKGDYTAYDYSDRCVLPSGQTIKITFEENWSNSKYYYNIYLVTMNKRKSEHNTRLKIMGCDGINGLLWAKRKVMEFEEFIKEKREGVPAVVYCTWDDNRRRNAYAFGLRKIGYQFGRVFGRKALCKTIV